MALWTVKASRVEGFYFREVGIRYAGERAVGGQQVGVGGSDE
jgi:hypothetical protein